MDRLDPEVAKLLREAHECLRAADANRATQLAIAAFTHHVNESLRFTFDNVVREKGRRPLAPGLVLADWPGRGVSIRREFGGAISAVFEAQSFDVPTAQLYLAYVEAQLQESSQLPAGVRWYRHRIYRFIVSLKSIALRIPPSWSRPAAALIALGALVFRSTRVGAEQYRWMLATIQEFIRVPKPEARRILHTYGTYQIYHRLDVERAKRGMRMQCPSADIIWEGEADYRRFVQRDRRSRLLTTMHFGNYFTASVRIAAHALPGREVISLQGGAGNLAEWTRHSLSSLSLRHEIVRDGSRSPLEIVKMLRQGNVTLSTPFDLGRNRGSTVEVQFFGRPAHFVKGPVELAVVSRVPILPYVCYRLGQRDYLHVAELIESHVEPGETLDMAVRRLVQVLVSFAEVWIRKYPQQWSYLPFMRSYFR